METIPTPGLFQGRLAERVLAPLRHTGMGWYVFVAVLVLVVAWGAFAYSLQLREGLILTGMRDRVSWGLYIAMYVFFVGASMAGTFVSAILRITKAGWRTPVTRAAEMVTVAALPIAFLFIIFNSRQDPHLTIYKLILYSRWESPITWDVYGLITYLAASSLYLYVALIPDLAYARDRIGASASTLRGLFLRFFSIGWRGTLAQRRHLQVALTVMMLLVIPIAVTMHTVTAWLFAMTVREPWDSPLFGIYFVGGAIFSGLGIIIILMAVMRKAYRLEEVITRRHFLYMGYMLAAFSAIMFYFNVNEYVGQAYKLRGEMATHLETLFTGSMAPLYWTYFWGGLFAPIVVMLLPQTRNIVGIVTASVLVNVGMFIERYLIVVGGLRLPLDAYGVPSYSPTWVEWSLTAGGIALFLLIITLLLKVVPGLAVTEMLEERARGEAALAPAPPTPGMVPRPQPSGGAE